MNSPDPKVSQGNARVNVTDFFSVGGGACRVVRLNERPRVRPAELLATPAARHPRPIGVRFTVLGCRWLAIGFTLKKSTLKRRMACPAAARKDARGEGAAMPMGAAAGARWTWSRDPDHDPDPRDPATRTRDTGVRGAGSTGAPSAQGVQTRGTCCMPGCGATPPLYLEPTLCARV